MNEAIDDYTADMVRRGLKPRGIETTGQRLRGFFPTHILVTEVSERRAKALYEASRTGKAADTHRNTLGQVKTFCNWLVERGDLPSNPFAKVKGQGKRRRGKAQLTIDEARALADACLSVNDHGATATLCCLLLALRAGEVAAIGPRSIDDGGRILRIDESKTEAGIRLVEVPEVLRPRLPAFAELSVSRHWVGYHVRRWCKLAGVPVVGPHALRGTHASLATRAGATSQLVAGTLGHASTAVTEAHYTRPEETAGAVQRSALTVLAGGRR